MANLLLPISRLVLASSSPPVASESIDAVMAATDIAWLKTIVAFEAPTMQADYMPNEYVPMAWQLSTFCS